MEPFASNCNEPLVGVIAFVFGLLAGRFLTQLVDGFRTKESEIRMVEFARRVSRLREDLRTAVGALSDADRTSEFLMRKMDADLRVLAEEGGRVYEAIRKRR